MKRYLNIALVAMESRVGSIRENIEKIVSFSHKASKKGADIVCFPELSITGYCISDSAKSVAISSLSDDLSPLVSVSERLKVCILAGMAEKGDDGNLYATHLVICDGKIAAKYRKIHLAPPEKGIYAPGNAPLCFEHNGWVVGIQLCYDSHFPELSSMYAMMGADLILIPFASPNKTPQEKLISWKKYITARAYDNSIYVACVNASGTNNKGLRFPATGLVLGPSGEILMEAGSENEALWSVVLKKGALDAVRKHPMRYFFANRRPDIYRIS